jgi:magnesium transporter
VASRASNAQHDRLNQPALDHAHRDFAGIRSSQSVAEALITLRNSDLSSRIVYVYVLDDDGRLCGVVPTRQLLLSAAETSVSDIMVRRVITLPYQATLLDACEMFVLHRLMAFPVTDDEGRILGVIDVDQYTEEISQLDEREESDEIFQIIGVRLAQIRHASVAALFRNRFPWLLCNIAGGIACAIIASFYTELLDQVVVMALFIPVVLALAESVSIQSLTLSLQIQHRRPASWETILWTLGREAPLGLMLGAACGGMVGGIAWLWYRQGGVSGIILVSISLSVMLAACYGLLVPSLLHKLQRDPKVASGPVTLTLTDITTTVVYLGIGTWWLM